ncbi:MAG: FkbM family methyltransferase [Asgard group archaeon]|nr:FkbM family methyltransferase [Asgard group archaeon]
MPRFNGIKYRSISLYNETLNFSIDSFRAWFWYWLKLRGFSFHEKSVFHKLKEVLSQDNILVDVGAHFGLYSLFASKKLCNGKVFALEMNRRNFQTLEKNIIINECTNIEAHNLAIANYCGKTNYQPDSILTTATSRLKLIALRKKHSKSNVLSVTTLDDFFQKKDCFPTIYKIDCEGAEYKILQGMTYILESIPDLQLFLELHPKYLRKHYNSSYTDVLTLLLSHDLTCYKIEDFRKNQSAPILTKIDDSATIRKNSMIYVTK